MSEPFLGAISIFAFNFAPLHYALAQGQLMQIQQNQGLFSLLGTSFGGDGIRTFGLPDLQSRLPIGVGQGPSLSVRNTGDRGGAEAVILDETTIPSHNHVLYASSAATADSAGGPSLMLGSLTAADRVLYAGLGAPNFKLEPLASGTVTGGGGNQPHNNIQPCLALNYAIALVGIFPSRG